MTLNPGRSDAPGDGPGGVWIKSRLLLAALFLVPPLLLVWYYRSVFGGLIHGDALDFAQIGRNLYDGKGFVTYVLRPLAMGEGISPLRQPDLTHGPLFPLCLALAFGAAGGPRDSLVAMVSGGFYLLTIPVIYLLGSRAFNRPVGMAAAWVFAVNALMLEYAVSGIHVTLCIFLATSLFLVLYNVALHAQLHAARPTAGPARALLAVAGILAGALWLADPFLIWLAPVAAGAVIWIHRPKWGGALAWFLVPFLVVTLPWMVRNAVLAGNPFLGLRAAEVWMHTGRYPGYLAYRMPIEALQTDSALVLQVLRKGLQGLDRIIRTFPEASSAWVLAFFLAGLFVRFSSGAANALRGIVVAGFLVLGAGLLAFNVQMALFTVFVPVMLVFAAAFLSHLALETGLGRPGVAGIAVVVGLICGVPVVHAIASAPPDPKPLPEAATARLLEALAAPDEICLSDQPWLVAWYGRRPSLWIPAADPEVLAARKRHKGMRWLYLTEQSRGYSGEWRSLYELFHGWNEIFLASRAGKKPLPAPLSLRAQGHPLLEALAGFTAVAPRGTTLPGAILAGLPRERAAPTAR